MVNMSGMVLPSVGELVRVAWGLASVPGRVVEVYEGARARVVVELDAGAVDDLATTVTVPLSAVEPIASSETAWARGARYERSVANALKRMGNELTRIDTGVADNGHEIDVLAEANDGRHLVIETKSQPIGSEVLSSAKRQAETAARALGAAWLVVAPDLIGRKASQSDPHFVRWKDESDDASLHEAILKALSEPGSPKP